MNFCNKTLPPSPDDSIRAFIALPLSPSIKKKISQLQNHLGKLNCPVRWTNPENIHITLKFLGNITSQQILLLKETLKHIQTVTDSFEIQLSELGAFPNRKNPRILWINITQGSCEIIQIAQSIEDQLKDLGFVQSVKSFAPHITIGRIRDLQRTRKLSHTIKNQIIPPDCQDTINEILLFKSNLSSKGPIHTKLFGIKLNLGTNS